MRATVLMENSTPSSRLLARHGLSLWLELADGRRILFDMGPDEGFIANARTLGVDVTTADAAVLSHGHYDHGGGLPAFLSACAAAGRDVPVYVRELARELDERDVRCLTFHCTGIEAFSILRDRLGERVGYLHVGSRENV